MFKTGHNRTVMPRNWNLMIRSVWMVRPEKEKTHRGLISEFPPRALSHPSSTLELHPSRRKQRPLLLPAKRAHRGRNVRNDTNLECHVQLEEAKVPAPRQHQRLTRFVAGRATLADEEPPHPHRSAAPGSHPGHHCSTRLILNACSLQRFWREHLNEGCA